MKTKEKLIRVKAESELRPGMIVVIKECAACSRSHRAMLLGLGPVELWRDRHGRLSERRGWEAAPPRPCSNRGRYTMTQPIAELRLFRVDDGIDDRFDEAERRCDEVMARLRARSRENAR